MAPPVHPGPGMPKRASWLAVCLLALASLPAAAAALTDPLLWPEPQRAFFQDGPSLLLPAAQRAALTELDEAAREAFIRGFLDRDPVPATPGNELREGIEKRRRLVDAEFPSPLDVRARLMFLNGRPAERRILDCGTAFKPLEVWTYGRLPEARSLVVYRPAADEPYRLWLPIDSKRALYSSDMEYWLEQWEELRGLVRGKRVDLRACPDAPLVDSATGIDGLGGRRTSRMFRPVDASGFLAPPADLAAWAKEAAATEVPAAPRELALGGIAVEFPARDGQRIVSRAVVEVRPGEVPAAIEEDGKQRLKLVVEGTVEHEGKPFEDFRMRYRVALPLAPGTEGALPLFLDRALRPRQAYLLRLRVIDEVSGAEARVARGFAVPAEPAAPAPGSRAAIAGEPLATLPIAGADTLLLLPPVDDLAIGLWRAEALVSGQRIAKVVFRVDGQEQLSRSRKPYSAELRLSPFPTEQVVRAEGYDEKGVLVAADEILLNPSRGAFKVTIVEPRRGAKPTGTVEARAEVTVPEERRVESVEFRVDDRVVATLGKPPWLARIEVPVGDAVAYLSVSALLDDGTRAEDVRFLNAPENLAEVEVNLVELYTTVTDGSGQLVRGLAAEDFEVLEGDRPQAIAKFELVENLPLFLGIVIDTSGSMASSLGEAQRAATGFLEQVIKPKDRSFAMAFASRPALLMPPTDDVAGVALSLDGLQAVGGTALHDAVVSSLYYFRGQRGQKALVLLSDGDDTASHIEWKDALEYARRSGVAVFPVGLGISGVKLGVRNKLSELAEATGGRAFFVGKAEELASTYGEIERELRSRYLLAFASEAEGGEAGFRPVEVKVKKRGLRARTARGYYP